MRILITGVSGLLGLNVALETTSQHHVIGVAHTTPIAGAPFQLVTANLLEPGVLQTLVEQTQPDWIIHCAALANIDACEKSPELARRINSEVPTELARITAQLSDVARGGARPKPVRLLHVSTDAVFDGTKGNYREDDATNPVSIYA